MTGPTRVEYDDLPLLSGQGRTTGSTEQGAKARQDSPSTDDLMDWLNDRMGEFFGSRWTSQYTRASLDTWAKGLRDMNAKQIRRGLTNCLNKNLGWPPTLPEFRELCLTVPNLPAPEDAWSEALSIARRWKRPHECSHVAIWHALDQIGGYTGIDEDVLRKRFERNYEKVCEMLGKGHSLAAIPQPLPAPKDAQPDYTSDAAVAARIAAKEKLAAMFRR